MHIVVVTHFVSPYQAELFNAVTAFGGIDLEVVYLHQLFHSRHWKVNDLLHKSICLDNEAGYFNDAKSSVLRADLAVFNYYAERPANELLKMRAMKGKPWCFWGERPGFHKPEWIGRLRRRWKLSWLHATPAPIWGIGRFAVERYQTEFGRYRAYSNLPYFSDLGRYQNLAMPEHEERERMFLFSGSLIHRKGVDLLARAFVRLAHEVPQVRLRFVGDGDLRDLLERTLQPVQERVEFLGFKDWPELPACYAGADVLCVPSRYDGWGLVVPEGLAAGLPVIGTNQMGAAIEFIETGRNGWLIDAGDENAIFAAIREASLLPSTKLAELSHRARKTVSKHSLRNGAERFICAAYDAYTNWGTPR